MRPAQKTPEQLERDRQEEAKDRARRHYPASKLPVFKDGAQTPPRQEVLLALYGEICNSWRMLTDVRFKLLGFVPTISVAVLITLLSREEATKGLSPIARAGIIIFGLLITIALYVYEQRNSQLYDDLISRGRRIEEELGVDTGQFRGRRQPPNFLIKHDVAISLIYGTVTAGWLFALLVTWLGWM
jgi:hypothetical protein